MSEELPDPTAVQIHFLKALPRIERHARIQFSTLDPEARDDAIAKAIGLAWKAYAREIERGRDPDTYVSAIAGYAVRQVRDNRDITGQETSRDVMSRHAQKKKKIIVQPFPEHDSSTDQNEALDALCDKRQSSPDEQAAFRIDFPEYVQAFPEKKREVVLDAALGSTTTELANDHDLSLGRVSQIRTEARKAWAERCAPPADRQR